VQNGVAAARNNSARSSDEPTEMTSSISAQTGGTSEHAVIPSRVKLVIIATVPETIMSFLVGQIRFLTPEGFEIHTITSPGIEEMPGHSELASIRHEVAMTRAVKPSADLKALWQLWQILRTIHPAIVQTRTPKAGLLGMIAAWLARVPIRIYTVDGMPIVSQRLPGRVMLAITDWISCRLATQVLCVSRSVRRLMIANHFCRSEKARTLGDGALSGVNLERFNPATRNAAERIQIRNQYGIPQNALLIGYIGRLVPDKGIAELAAAWETLRKEFPEAHLFLCGYFEAVHPVALQIAEKLTSDPRVHVTGKWVSDMPAVYAAIDVCVLPTYREGLSTVVLECGAMRLPIVATRVTGCVDAIRNGVTGLIVEAKDAEALAGAIRSLLQSQELRVRIGNAAREFVSNHFSENRISKLVLGEYRRLIENEHRDRSTRRSQLANDDGFWRVEIRRILRRPN
jgi:glycosyltransferase involved in cell wall biosynthesis